MFLPRNWISILQYRVFENRFKLLWTLRGWTSRYGGITGAKYMYLQKKFLLVPWKVRWKVHWKVRWKLVLITNGHRPASVRLSAEFIKYTCQLRERRQSLTDGISPAFFDALLLGQDRFMTNSHGYIYGVLGMVNTRSSMAVDHGNYLLSLNGEAFQSVIQQARNLDILKRVVRYNLSVDSNQPQRVPSYQTSEPAWPS